MYKLLIVEDEKWEREGLVEFLDWSEMDIDIIGAAANGVQGLKLAWEYHSDIIITDIKMPIMDGIEFTRKVKDILPECRIIIITGYDDFEYAKEAIKLGVYEYLLKPVKKEQLVEVLNKTVEAISEGRYRVKYLLGLKRQMAESKYEDRERFLLGLLDGTFNTQQASEAADWLEMITVGQGIIALVVRFDGISLFGDKEYVERQTSLKELFVLTRKIVSEEGITARNNNEMSEIVICLPSEGTGREYIYDVIHQIRQVYCGAEVPEAVIGVGSASKTLQGFAESFKQAEAALDYIFFMKDAEILFYEDIPQREELHETEIYSFFTCAAEYSKKVLRGIISMDSEGVSAISEELFEIIEKRSVAKGLVCNLIASLISEITTLLHSNDISFSFKMLNEDIVGTLNKFIRLQDMKNWFQEILLHANYCISEKKNNKDEYIVKKVMDIIRQQYESNIGIETIARRLELSPNYLGSLFKQYMGKYFTEVLTDFRMKKAEELLASGSENVNGTAKAVGFVNVGHFCKVFKKTHGISPLAYQKKYFKE